MAPPASSGYSATPAGRPLTQQDAPGPSPLSSLGCRLAGPSTYPSVPPSAVCPSTHPSILPPSLPPSTLHASFHLSICPSLPPSLHPRATDPREPPAQALPREKDRARLAAPCGLWPPGSTSYPCRQHAPVPFAWHLKSLPAKHWRCGAWFPEAAVVCLLWLPLFSCLPRGSRVLGEPRAQENGQAPGAALSRAQQSHTVRGGKCSWSVGFGGICYAALTS